MVRDRRVAALLGGSAALRQQVKTHERWAIAGGMGRERLNASLGPPRGALPQVVHRMALRPRYWLRHGWGWCR